MTELTDLEAYQKSCPMCFNSPHWGRISYSGNCVASKCMWWQWNNIQYKDGRKRGYCGAIPAPITVHAGSLPVSDIIAEQKNA